MICSFAWSCYQGSWRKLSIGLVLTGLNAILLFHNLDAFESPAVHQEQLHPAGSTLETTKVPQLRGTRIGQKTAGTGALKTLAATPPTKPPVLPQEPKVADLISSALAQNATQIGPQIIKFRSPSWTLSRLTLSLGQELPFAERFEGINNTHGRYLGHDNVVFLSPCTSGQIHKMDIPFGDFLKEKAAFLQMRCSSNETMENLAAKQVVVYVNFRESGYYGHAIDTILPRVFAVMDGVVQSGHGLTLVLPALGKRSLSENTRVLCELLGIEVRQRVPITPHRTMGLSGVSAWSREHRKIFQQAIWAAPRLKLGQGGTKAFLRGSEEKACEEKALAEPPCGCRIALPGIFLGRHATRNSRPVVGAEFLENEFVGFGFELLRNAEAVPLVELAQKIHSSCSLVGFAGTAMVNLIFLPGTATVIDFNPYLIYANTWLWSHALTYCFCQVQSPRKIDQHDAQKWASVILGNQSSEKFRPWRCSRNVEVSVLVWPSWKFSFDWIRSGADRSTEMYGP